jgi:type II secretory pathway pseudopilin PulG
MRWASARSYTLIELIMVIAVLALAAALLTPHLVGRDSLTIQAAVRLVIADLSFAQTDALANQEFRRVQFFGDGTGYCLIRVTEADFPPEDPFDELNADYLIDPLGGREYVVRFDQDDRFQGVSIDTSQTTIDGRQLAAYPTAGVSVNYDQIGGTVHITSAALPGAGGDIVLNYDDESYRISIEPFTGKLTVAKL